MTNSSKTPNLPKPSASASGADFKSFYKDPTIWDKDGKSAWYVEELALKINGGPEMYSDELYDTYGEELENLPDDAKIQVSNGWFAWQGSGAEPRQETDLKKIFKKWVSEQTTSTIIVRFEIDKNNVDQISELLEKLSTLGAKSINHDGTILSQQDEPQNGKNPKMKP